MNGDGPRHVRMQGADKRERSLVCEGAAHRHVRRGEDVCRRLGVAIEAHVVCEAGKNEIDDAVLRDVEEAGFVNIESFSFDCDVMFTPQSWLGRIRASSGVGASLAPEKIEKFERDLRQILLTHFPSERLIVPHRVFAVVSQKPGLNA